MKKEFLDPGAKFRPAPFWSWNSDMNRDEIRRQISDFSAHGFGGAFAHARQGLITEYLSDDFFDAWAVALDESKKRGNAVSSTPPTPLSVESLFSPRGAKRISSSARS